MEKIKKLALLIFACSLLISQLGYAQIGKITKRNLKDFSLSSGRIITIEATKTVGSPYLFNEFIKGQVKLDNGLTTSVTYLRLNIEKNQLEFLRDKEILITNASKINSFKIFGKRKDLIFKNGYKTKMDDITPDTFLQVAYEGGKQVANSL